MEREGDLCELLRLASVTVLDLAYVMESSHGWCTATMERLWYGRAHLGEVNPRLGSSVRESLGREILFLNIAASSLGQLHCFCMCWGARNTL